MIKLNPRLLRCASLVSGDFVLDIGTDHGYLPCFLVESGTCREALACDIAPGPLDAAAKHIADSGLTDKIKTVLSDGLKSLPESACAATDIVVAGMGGEMIVKILAEGGDFPKSRRLILQPNTRASQLRRWLLENGYDIISESAVRDGKFLYTVICAAYCGVFSAPDELECAVGRLSPREPADREYLIKEIEKLSAAAEGMGGSDCEKTRAEGVKTAALAMKIREYMRG